MTTRSCSSYALPWHSTRADGHHRLWSSAQTPDRHGPGVDERGRSVLLALLLLRVGQVAQDIGVCSSLSRRLLGLASLRELFLGFAASRCLLGLRPGRGALL